VSEVEFIVVGSGASGATAATTLIENGARVLMLDGGQRDERYAGLIPEQSFVALRTSDEEQHRYLLGEHFESIATAGVMTGAQLTPPRRFIVAEVNRFLPVSSNNFAPLESLALGGLGSGWGLGCCVFSRGELTKAGLPVEAMRGAYQAVGDRIGISGTEDDAAPYTFAHLRGIQPSTPLDPTANRVLEAYIRKRRAIQAAGFRIGRPAMALLTEPKEQRRASLLRDMEFYSDADRAAWRPWMAIEVLERDARFQYQPGHFVTSFEERDDRVVVNSIDMRTLQRRTHEGKRLLLAAGALGSARIAARSSPNPVARLPLLCNPYTYLPSVVPSRLGKGMPEKNTALCQLAIFHDPDACHDDVAMGFVYSYRSLMMFRLLKEMPLNLHDGRILLSYLMSGFLIVGVHHPHRYSARTYLRLEPSADSVTGDRLVANYELDSDQAAAVDARDLQYMRMLRRLGAWPIRRVRPEYGSSIHYAGTLPFCDEETPLTLARDGRLHGTRRVFVADGSGFTYLPAKGLTLSLMANAHIVAAGLARRAPM
jgi:choline dehydrogenase-like flavoprotein